MHVSGSMEDPEPEEQQRRTTAVSKLKPHAQLIACFIVPAYSLLYILAFTRIYIFTGFIGFGDVVFSTLIREGRSTPENLNVGYGLIIAIGSLVLLLLVYLLDVVNWGDSVKKGVEKSILKALKWIILFALVLAAFVTSLLLTYKVVFAPYVAFIVASIATVAVPKLTVFKSVRQHHYLVGVIGGIIISFVCVLALWSVSLAQGNVYNSETLIKYHQRLNCPSGAETYDQLLIKAANGENVTAKLPGCEEAYLVYIAPFIFLAGCVIYVGVLFFLYRADKARVKTGNEIALEPVAQVFIVFSVYSGYGWPRRLPL